MLRLVLPGCGEHALGQLACTSRSLRHLEVASAAAGGLTWLASLTNLTCLSLRHCSLGHCGTGSNAGADGVAGALGVLQLLPRLQALDLGEVEGLDDGAAGPLAALAGQLKARQRARLPSGDTVVVVL